MVSDRFEVIEPIGAGGMGEVYSVRDRKLGGRVALKTLKPKFHSNPEFLARFRREIRMARRVSHPNVCRVHDIGSFRRGSEEINFLAMELIDGESLAQLIGARGGLPLEEALPLISQMAQGLQALHDEGIVHRDFKPSNVMIRESREAAAPGVVITDFGLARPVGIDPETVSSITATGLLLGTPEYMSPEQLRGEPTGPRSDVYAFGLVICETLTGRHHSGARRAGRIPRLPRPKCCPCCRRRPNIPFGAAWRRYRRKGRRRPSNWRSR